MARFKVNLVRVEQYEGYDVVADSYEEALEKVKEMYAEDRLLKYETPNSGWDNHLELYQDGTTDNWTFEPLDDHPLVWPKKESTPESNPEDDSKTDVPLIALHKQDGTVITFKSKNECKNYLMWGVAASSGEELHHYACMLSALEAGDTELFYDKEEE